jgi:UDP-2-acetamido-3-amino-2,3-dideoxy-glucuronate N-acetyltransferase
VGKMSVFVHDTAVIDDGAQLGQGSRIWHFAHICGGACIGERVSIGQNVFVAATAVVGDGCKIQNNVSIYDGVTLDRDVFCGPSMVFTNVMNPRAHVERKTEYRKTHVGQGATLGANSTIVCGITVGAFAFVGAGSVVTRDVPEFALIVGNPARQIGWMSAAGERLDLQVTGAGEARCPRDGDIYRLEGEVLTRVG